MKVFVNVLASYPKCQIPNILNAVNSKVKTRCSFQPMLSNTPPQEHGTYGLNLIIKRT